MTVVNEMVPVIASTNICLFIKRIYISCITSVPHKFYTYFTATKPFSKYHMDLILIAFLLKATQVHPFKLLHIVY